MPPFGHNLHLFVDSAFQRAVAARKSLASEAGARHGLGASLPGGQVFLSAEVVRDDDGFELLRTGDTKHSLWRTVEWRLLRALLPEMRRPFLDLGCGDGSFGSLVTDRVEFGVDGDADAVGQCDPRVYGSVHSADLRQALPIAAGSIATAFSNSTLEHVTPLAPAITAVARTLVSGGKLIATVPTSGITETMTTAYGTAFAERMNRTWGHHNLWSWAQWEELLRSEGFATVNFRGYLSRPAVQWYCRRSLTPWPQYSRRDPNGLWARDRKTIRALVEESLRVTAECETTCALIVATRS